MKKPKKFNKYIEIPLDTWEIFQMFLEQATDFLESFQLPHEDVEGRFMQQTIIDQLNSMHIYDPLDDCE